MSPAVAVRRTVLDNGLRVVTDAEPDRAGASVAVWVAVGSRDEPDHLAGASHFLEHLLFKGTPRRDARSLAFEIDSVGGEMNAFTGSEHTAFYASVPAGASHLALDILLDVVDDPLLAPTDVDAERRVILEELAAAEEDPDDTAAVRLYESLFPQHPLGRETLGTMDSIAAMGAREVREFLERWYQPANLVVVAAGAVDHDEMVAATAERLGQRSPGAEPVRTPPSDGLGPDSAAQRPVDLDHIALGWRAPGILSDDRFALGVLDHLFGASPSSHLFQEIREVRGLTYAVGSEVSAHADAGALTVHCASSPSKSPRLVDLVDHIAGTLASGSIDAEEVERAKRALRGSLMRSFDSPSARMARIGVGETSHGEVLDVREHLERLDAVTVDDVRRVAAEVLGGPRVMSTVGPGGFSPLG